MTKNEERLIKAEDEFEEAAQALAKERGVSYEKSGLCLDCKDGEVTIQFFPYPEVREETETGFVVEMPFPVRGQMVLRS